jgi:putative transposase
MLCTKIPPATKIIAKVPTTVKIRTTHGKVNTNPFPRFTPTFYNWKRKYGGMDAQQLKELKTLQEENRRLKHMYADLSLDHRILKDIIEKKL